MKIISNTTEFSIPQNTVVAIGKFDGFHKGHHKLIDMAVEQKKRGLAVAVYTFVPSPAIFWGKGNVQELSTIEEKRHIFERAGADYLVEYPFNQEVADMEPETYIKDVLIDKMHAKCIVAGTDVSFGKKGAGNYELLQTLSEKYGYQVILIDKVQFQNREISSTFVKEQIKAGNMEVVTQLLENPYSVTGRIVHGKQLGRTIGMPTVNVIPEKEKLLPPNGVYFSYVELHGKRYPSVTNIGKKPTVDNSEVIGVETYIYDFSGDIYGETISVFLLKFRRPEMRFSGVEELKNQMEQDLQAGRAFHEIG